jgi:hypothetical protein
MKQLIVVLLAIVLIVSISTLTQAQIHWRGAKTMPQGSFLAMTSWYMMNFNQSYDWANEEWKDYSSDKEMTYWGFESMVGYAITDRIEAHLHIPLTFKSLKMDPNIDLSSSGIGDMFLKGRYALIPWTKDQHGLTLTANLRLATGDKDADIALGDGTTDFGVGAIFSSAWMNKFRGHLKAGYWINGENDDKINVGDELKVIAKLDRKISPKVVGFLTYIYYSQGEKENDGTAVTNSEKNRNYVALGGVWKPKKGMFVRPKVLFPIGGEGGSLFAYKPLIDFWYVFKL